MPTRQQSLTIAIHIVTSFILLYCVSPAFAQVKTSGQYPKYEIFAGYLAAQSGYNDLHFGSASLQSGFASTHGAEVSFLRNFNTFLGIKGDFSLQPHSENFLAEICPQLPCSPVAQSAALNPKLFNFLGGPEVKFRRYARLAPYAHGLIGIAHSTASFSTSGPAANFTVRTSSTGFATALGGGADIRIARRLSFRTGMDFNPAWIGQDDSGARAVVKNFRLWGGVLFH